MILYCLMLRLYVITLANAVSLVNRVRINAHYESLLHGRRRAAPVACIESEGPPRTEVGPHVLPRRGTGRDEEMMMDRIALSSGGLGAVSVWPAPAAGRVNAARPRQTSHRGSRSMRRRQFLTTGVATGAAMAGATVSAPAIGRGQRELKLVTSFPPNYPGFGPSAARVARRITTASGGRIKVRLFHEDELVPTFGVFDAVSDGIAEMYFSLEYYFPQKSPAFNFFTAVPFGMTHFETWAWMMYGGGYELWRGIHDQFGMVPFLGPSAGVQMGGWFNRRIASIGDFQGVRFRMPGLGGEVAAGAWGQRGQPARGADLLRPPFRCPRRGGVVRAMARPRGRDFTGWSSTTTGRDSTNREPPRATRSTSPSGGACRSRIERSSAQSSKPRCSSRAPSMTDEAPGLSIPSSRNSTSSCTSFPTACSPGSGRPPPKSSASWAPPTPLPKGYGTATAAFASRSSGGRGSGCRAT